MVRSRRLRHLEHAAVKPSGRRGRIDAHAEQHADPRVLRHVPQPRRRVARIKWHVRPAPERRMASSAMTEFGVGSAHKPAGSPGPPAAMFRRGTSGDERRFPAAFELERVAAAISAAKRSTRWQSCAKDIIAPPGSSSAGESSSQRSAMAE